MKSSYKRIGDLIVECDERNTRGGDLELWGVSIDKKFIKSVANIIGTDLSKYKVVDKDCFVCSLMQVSRDEKIPIARWNKVYSVLVSPAYKVFRVVNSKNVLPEYIDLWFKRAEFDREASFYGVGGVRGSLEWSDFCDMILPIPEIEEQQRIVNAYNVIEHRIAIKRQINDNLESQIQTIYNDLFTVADFNASLGDLTECILGGTPSRDEPSYWNGEIAWINSGKINDFRVASASEYITAKGLAHSATKLLPYHTVVIAITGATMGRESILLIESCANQSVIGVLQNERLPYEFIHPFIKSSMRELLRNQTGGAQPHINKDDVSNIPICVPDSEQMTRYIAMVQPLYAFIEKNCFEMDQLANLLDNSLAVLSR